MLQDSKDFQLKNYLPNLLSLYRIITSLFLFILILIEQFYLALTFFILDILSDILDGNLARKLDVSSKLGCHLDIFGDFSCIFFTIVAFTIKEIYPLWVLIAVILLFVQFLITSKIDGPIYDPVGKYYGTFLFGMLVITLIDIEAHFTFHILTCFLIFTLISIASRILALYGIKKK